MEKQSGVEREPYMSILDKEKWRYALLERGNTREKRKKVGIDILMGEGAEERDEE